MSVTEPLLLNALKTVVDPNTGKDFVATKQLKNLRVDGSDVVFDIELGYPAKSQVAGIRKALIAAVRALPEVENVSVNVATKITPHAVQRATK